MDSSYLRLFLSHGYTFLLAALMYKMARHVINIFRYSGLFMSTQRNQLSIFSFNHNSNNNLYSNKDLFLNNRRKNQSPINITRRNAIAIKTLKPLKWIGYSTPPMQMIIHNDGITVSIRGFWSDESMPYIEGGLLKSRYYFHSITFHWKNFHNDGSEHSFDGVKFPLEMQVMHVKEHFKSLSAAMQSTDDINHDNSNITTISYIFQIAEEKNVLLESILTDLSRVQKTYSKVYIPPIRLDSVLPLFESKYYSYNGSLTQTPYCETVTWIIHPEPLPISSSQMKEFYNLHSTNGLMIHNSRSVQNLNDRHVLFIGDN